jgi:uncharacterized protein
VERISGDGFFSYRRGIDRKKDSRRTSTVSSFSSELRETEGGPVELRSVAHEAEEAETAALLDAVFEVGDRLKRRRDGATLASYREAVRRFLAAVVQRAVDVEEKTSGSSITRRKRYALVKVIDGKLEQLAAGMVSSQHEQLDLLARIDEINGMLIDLSH